VHLVVDTTSTHGNLEGTLITPGVVPGVNAEPVVLTVLSTPTDGLDGVTTESRSRLMGVNTALVGKEVLVDGEGRGDGTVLVDVRLDGINGTETIGRAGEVLVRSVVDGRVGLAVVSADGINSNDIVTASKIWDSNVVSTLGHSVVEAKSTITIVTTSSNTVFVEPVPWGTNLSTVATLGEAVLEITAASGVRNREEVVDTFSNASSVVKSFGGTVSPAGTAVRLIADVVDDISTLRPVLTSIEAIRDTVDDGTLLVSLNGPLRVDDSTKKLLNFLV